MSLRSKADFALLWQSRGSAIVATKPVAPRNTPLRSVAFAAKTAARLRTIRTIHQNRAIFLKLYIATLQKKSFDREGWVVGVAVTYTSNIL